jgi:hypothetical protein
MFIRWPERLAHQDSAASAGIGFWAPARRFDLAFGTLRLLEDGAWRYAACNLLLFGPLSFAGALVAFLAVRGL